MTQRHLSLFLFSIVLSLVLASCGGGGGGGGDPPAPPTNPIVLTVKVNNIPATLFAGNVTGMASGDTISVTASVPVTWSPTLTGALVTNLAATATTWTARIAKPSTAAALYLLAATAGTNSTSLTINVPAGDTRNGNYKLFSTDANEYALMIDFDTRQYTLRTATGAGILSSNFTGPVDGTYTFNVTDFLQPPGGNARFRVENGLIVGLHTMGSTQFHAFIGANHFVTSAADLPLTNLWMFASDVDPADNPAINSRIQAVRLAANQITYCSVATGAITTVANCLPANLATHTLTFNPDVGSVTWLDNGVPVNLYVVRAGTELILVRAQSYPTTTGNKRFQLALDDAASVTTGGYEAYVSNGSRGAISFAITSTYTRSAATPAGTPDNVQGTMTTITTASPLRTLVSPGDGVNYFVQSTNVLAAEIAARNSSKAGQVAFGLKR